MLYWNAYCLSKPLLPASRSDFPLIDSLEYSSKFFTEIALKKTLFYNANLGRGSIGLISSQDTFKLIKDEIKFAPYFLTKADMMGIKEPNIIKIHLKEQNAKFI